jgi:hypothetical protein
MSRDWWIIPTLALGLLAGLLGAAGMSWRRPEPHRPWTRPGCYAVALVFLAGVAGVGPIWDGLLRRRHQDLCQRHLIQLAFSLLLYAQDYDERFPPAWAWCDAAEPTLPSAESFHCPADRPERRYSYAANRAVGLQPCAAVSRVVLLFESDQGVRNAHGGQERLAPATRHNPFHLGGLGLFRPNPAYSGHFFAFGDGQVKWLTPAERQAAGAALWEVP